MNSFSFPNMIDINSGSFIEKSNKNAISQAVRLVLLSSKTSLLGDPYFGTNLKKLLFNPNDIVLEDLVTDEIYTALSIFVPEITFSRSDIKLIRHTGKLVIEFNAIYNRDGTRSLYSIPLVNIEEL